MSTNLGEVKDQTLQALGSGGSAQSGMLGLGGEFKPNVDLSFLNPFKKDDMEEGGKGSGRKAKPGGAKDIENRMSAAVDDANARLDAAEKAAKKK